MLFQLIVFHFLKGIKMLIIDELLCHLEDIETNYNNLENKLHNFPELTDENEGDYDDLEEEVYILSQVRDSFNDVIDYLQDRIDNPG